MKATHIPTPTAHDPAMTPGVLLRGAAVYLTRHGWTQHQFFDMAADSGDPFPPACASGAIIAAAFGRCIPSGVCTVDGSDDPDTLAALRAMRFFADWLDDGETISGDLAPSCIDAIGDWNDDEWRSRYFVIQSLQDAANDWDAANPAGEDR